MSGSIAIVWFRQDLRLRDNPALRYACDNFNFVLPVFVWSPGVEGPAALGSASRVWLHHSLVELSERIEKRGGRLLVRTGDPRTVLPEVVSELSATAVFWNRRYEPPLTSLDADVKTALSDAGCTARSFKANLLYEPWEVSTNESRPYQVFTPFWKSARTTRVPGETLPEPKRIARPDKSLPSLAISELELLPTIPWHQEVIRAWQPGEIGGQKRLREFLGDPITEYDQGRDFPAQTSTSRLSPHLHFGEVSPRQILHSIEQRKLEGRSIEAFIRQLGWREFAHHVLHHFPQTIDQPLQRRFEKFRWDDGRGLLSAWQKGLTGYPIVDAGMRQLWQTGWMHNRVRMIVASFLVKDLLIDWRQGAAWFWDTLVDGDLANNTMGWQWAAGCGADPAPYFRVFNPTRQGEQFDPEGEYVHRWVPELARLPAKWIHKPWEAPVEILRQSQVILGTSYPRPIVDHAAARLEALKRFDEIK